MKRSRQGRAYPAMRNAIKTVLMIKFIFILVSVLTIQSFGRGFGQKKITIDLKNVELKQALKALEAQGDYRLVYKDEIIPKGSRVNLKVEGASLEQVLDKMLENTTLSYKQLNEQLVVITQDKEEAGNIAPFVKTVSGRVVNEQGAPLAGVTILERGTTNGTSSKEDGSFTLSVAGNNASLEVSFVGYTTQTIKVGDQSAITIRLASESKQMEEVVVVGYGTQRVTKVSGAISTVKAADIEKVKAVRTEEALQGRTSGVSVIQSGSPGVKPTVLIRGIPSYSGNDPIVIVDGSPQSLDDLNSINPSDIESINVLKDASTTAIYGVHGGNGVIVVTTKSGRKNQKTEITVNSAYGFQEAINIMGVLNATEYAAIINEGSLTSGGNVIFPDISKLGVGTDWQKQVFKKAPIQTYNVQPVAVVKKWVSFYQVVT